MFKQFVTTYKSVSHYDSAKLMKRRFQVASPEARDKKGNICVPV